MKHTVLLLTLLVSTPAFANDCKTIADDVVRQDQLLTAETHEFAARSDDIKTPKADASIAIRQDFLRRLDALINTMRRDIDGMRWLIAHHCGPAEEELNAIKSVHDMELTLIGLLVRRMDARALR